MKSNQECILCGNCIKICPDKAPKLNLRLPGHELWTFLRPEETVIVLLPLILATQFFRGLEITPLFHQLDALLDQHVVSLTLCLLVMIPVAYLFIRVAGSSAFSRLKEPEIKKADLFIYALVPLCFSFELSYHVEPLLRRAGFILPVLGRQLGFNWDMLGVNAAQGSITLLQFLLIMVGLIASRITLNKIRERQEVHHTPQMGFRRGWPLLALAGVFLYFFLVA